MTRRMIWPLVFGLVGAAILIGLGVWQVQRLAWKQAILTKIDETIQAPPLDLDAAMIPKVIEFAPVRLDGRFTGEELHVLSSIPQIGAIYRVVAAFEMANGRRILVDRGYVPNANKDAPRPGGKATVTGNLRFPQETDGFTPEPDLVNNIWFARDAETMSKALNTDKVFVILRDATGDKEGITPLPLNSAGIANDHFSYAMTWFSLAAIWLGMTAYLLLRIRARTD